MADDFDMSEAIEADRRSRKEWEVAVSRAAPENPEAGSFTEVAPGVVERNLKMIYIPPPRIKVAATLPGATEMQCAASEADFNKFLAVDREKFIHFPGCACERCVKVRADYPPYLITKDGSVRRISEAAQLQTDTNRKADPPSPYWMGLPLPKANPNVPDGYLAVMDKWIIGVDPAYPTETIKQSETDLGRQLDASIGFVPMSQPAPSEPPAPSPIPARALRYGVAEAPLLEWPD